MKNKMDQEYSFALRPASIEEAGLFYSNDEQDEALGTVGHLRLDFGHGFLPLRSTCYPHNDDQFDTLEFKILLREFLEAMQENGPLASLLRESENKTTPSYIYATFGKPTVWPALPPYGRCLDSCQGQPLILHKTFLK